jgi:PAS domain S-box-containing protein
MFQAELMEPQFADVLRDISDGFGVLDRDGRFVFANESAADLLSAPRFGLVGCFARQFFPEREASLSSHMAQKSMAEGCPASARAHARTSGLLLDVSIYPTGSLFAVLLRPAPAVGAKQRVSRDADTGFAGVAVEAGAAIATVSLDGQWLAVNQPLCDLLGRTEAELQAMMFEDVCHPDDMRAIDDATDRLGQETTSASMAVRFHRPDGSPVPVQITAFRVRDGEGQPQFYVVTMEDVGLRETAFARLRRSEERFRLFVANAPVSTVMLDRDLRYLAASNRWLQNYGLTEPIIGRLHYDVFPDLPERWKELHRRCLAGEVIPSTEDRFERADGSVLWFRFTMRPWHDADGEIGGIIICADNVTEQKRLEAELLQSQKLDSLGRLAGGIAHDFNNLLTAILGYAELAQEECEPDSAQQEHLRNIIQPAQSAARLTHQLLAFARRQVVVPQVADIGAMVCDMGNMLRRLVPENVDLIIRPDPDLHPVEVDTGQFEQTVVNLVVNARDSMPEGGKIEIRARNATIATEAARALGDIAPGEYVELSVADTGCGIDEATRQRIFEPFFTTKGMGRGTGLGLATVYGIVRQAGGYVWISSEPGSGATFKVFLPRTAAALEPVRTAQAVVERQGGRETILLVEDETPVRSLVVASLRAQGYNVLEAGDGVQALEVANGREKDIALVVSDVIMPRMGGRELAERLRSLQPELNVLFCSGYAEEGVLPEASAREGIAFLPKPFAPAALLRKVRELLDGRGAHSLASAA